MTAEVAILNKSAVALAADSAVTIGQSPNTKIYNTVNKIFELSSSNPVGIMIYGRLDFMGLPLETIIKEYRKSLGPKKFSKIYDYQNDFSKYLESEVPISNENEIQNVGAILYDLFSRSNRDIDKLIMQDIYETGRYRKSKVNSIIQSYLDERISDLKSCDFSDGFTKKVPVDKYRHITDFLINKCFSSNFPTETTKKKIRDFAGYFLAKSVLSSIRTGVVITGFGADELCPRSC